MPSARVWYISISVPVYLRIKGLFEGLRLFTFYMHLGCAVFPPLFIHRLWKSRRSLVDRHFCFNDVAFITLLPHVDACG
jgi:hypothetical protein